MKKLSFLIVMLLLFSGTLFAQVGINIDGTQPDPSAGLDVKFDNKGFLPPRIALTSSNSATPVTSPAIGLLVYNTTNAGVSPDNVVPGYYYWNGINWISLAVPAGTNVGDMLYWNGTQWIGISVGTNGQVLTLNNGVPVWGGTQVPMSTTTSISSITSLTAISGGTIMFDGGSSIVTRGVCWNTTSHPTITNYHTTDGNSFGTFVSALNGLTPNTLYFVRAYATNNVGTAYGNELSFTTLPTCGTITTNHVASGGVAPVDKAVTYGTVTNIPGEPSKCWITSNLGSDQQATAADDATEASAGWYWQFNLKQGYKHDGTTRTPNSTWLYPINENSDWTVANDPCALELGSGWRIPTKVEWTNVDASDSWANWNGPWNSGLKLHAAGLLGYMDGFLYNRGSMGFYWSNTQNSAVYSWNLNFGSGNSLMSSNYKSQGFPLRCIKD